MLGFEFIRDKQYEKKTQTLLWTEVDTSMGLGIFFLS